MSRCRRLCAPTWAVLALTSAAWGSACDDVTEPAPDQAVPATVIVSPDTVELAAIGDSVQLTAEVRDQNGRVMPGADVWWRSSRESVATVDSTGLVQGVGRGAATIVATVSSAQGRSALTVADPDRAVSIPERIEWRVGIRLSRRPRAADRSGPHVLLRSAMGQRLRLH